MSLTYKPETPVVESRFLISVFIVMFVIFLLLGRLWYLQIYKGHYYLKISENNRVRRIDIFAPRGTVYDRHGQVIIGNKPFFDLVYIPQYVKDKEKTVKVLSSLLHLSPTKIAHRIKKNRGRPTFMPITLAHNLSVHEVSMVQNAKVFLPGIEVQVIPRRNYANKPPAHLSGYVAEITKEQMTRKNKDPQTKPYFLGDLVGKQGIELKWEDYLRGQRGYRMIQVDAFGRQRKVLSKDKDWSFPAVTPARPGADLYLTLDMRLQKIAEKAFEGKNGAVVAMNPQNGEVLVLVSEPHYDPQMYQESVSFEKWNSLVSHPFKPLFDKTTGGAFAPGSLYKPVVAFAALEEGVITDKTRHKCVGRFDLGRDTFHCHKRQGHGHVDLLEAMKHSCDVFFYEIGMALGADKIAKYAKDFGLGEKLGLDLNYEDPGVVPTTWWKKKTTNRGWLPGDIPNLAIGQSANLTTPLQLASLFSSIANGGKVWRRFEY